MNLLRTREHAARLRAYAAETTARSEAEPENFLLKLIAKNQRDAAEEQELKLCLAEGHAASQSLEWRLIGQRTQHGQVPLAMLGKIADALNKLLLRAAYFARTGEELIRASDDFSREMNLKLAGLAEGSARLLIVGNTMPDTTGSAPLETGIEHILDALEVGNESAQFYESLGNLGEQATDSLLDVLKVMEQEECSVEVTHHSASVARSEMLRFDQIVHMRSMLKDSSGVQVENAKVSGVVGLLSSSGRIQIVTHTAEKVNIRFNRKKDGEWVSSLRLGQFVEIPTKARIYRDPATGEVTRVHRLSVT